MQGTQVQSLGWEDTLEKGMQPTVVFLPGEFHGQKSLVGYSPWVSKSQTRLSAWVCPGPPVLTLLAFGAGEFSAGGAGGLSWVCLSQCWAASILKIPIAFLWLWPWNVSDGQDCLWEAELPPRWVSGLAHLRCLGSQLQHHSRSPWRWSQDPGFSGRGWTKCL